MRGSEGCNKGSNEEINKKNKKKEESNMHGITPENKVLTIQDISCFGQCSLTVALPIISACGVETAIMPSAVLSTHTGGFSGFTFRDLSDDLAGIERHWVKEGVSFMAIYTGYLGSSRQMDDIEGMFETLLAPGGKRIIDPVMADHGKLYQGFDMDYVSRMKEFCKKGDIILPNMTEAALMVGMEYREEQTEEYVADLMARLKENFSATVVLKGLTYKEKEMGVCVFSREKSHTYFAPRIPANYHGTGDCYASAFTGLLMRGRSISEAAAVSADFVRACIENTLSDEGHRYGVKFEGVLPMLVKALETKGTGDA